MPALDVSSLRLDYVATMPGAIRSARTYSLILQDEVLYILDIGPAKGVEPNVSGLVKALSTFIVARVEKKMNATIEANITDLDARGPEAYVARKGSVAIGPGDLTSCEARMNGWGSRTLTLKTGKGDFAFIPPPGGQDELDAFGEVLRAWAELA